MKEQNTTEFREVSVRLRKDFQFDVATPLKENAPEYVLDMLQNLMGKVDMETYCLLEFDTKARLIREITYAPRVFQKALRQPEGLLRQIILDKPSSIIVVYLTGYFFPKYINWDRNAARFMSREIDSMQQLGALSQLANVKLLDYIVSDYSMEKRFIFSEESLLKPPGEYFERYLSEAGMLVGMEVKPEPAARRKYDHRYPVEITPSWHYSGYGDVKTPADAIFAVRELIQDSDREILGVINLDGWKPLNFQLSAIGNGNVTAVDSGLLLRPALLSNANAVILFHNHPSGDVEPSLFDIMMTEKMKCLCEKCGIAMMDHVIIGFNNDFCYSFYRNSIFDAQHKESPFQSVAEHMRETCFKEHTKDEMSGNIESENIAAEKTLALKKHIPRR